LPELPVMRAIGVREIALWLAGDMPRDVMIRQVQTATRQFAKRQYTWFNRQLPGNWDRTTTEIDNNIIDEIIIKLLK